MQRLRKVIQLCHLILSPGETCKVDVKSSGGQVLTGGKSTLPLPLAPQFLAQYLCPPGQVSLKERCRREDGLIPKGHGRRKRSACAGTRRGGFPQGPGCRPYHVLGTQALHGTLGS